MDYFYAIVGNALIVYFCYKFYMFGINEGFQMLFEKLFKRKKKEGVNSGQRFG